MNQYNPYQAPLTSDSSGALPDSALEAIMAALRATRPWVMFLSVLGFLGSGLLFILGLFVLVAGDNFARQSSLSGMGSALGLIYFVLGGIYIVPSLLLWRYAASISDFTASGGQIDLLAAAIERQKSFWRFSGISMAVVVGLYAFLFFIGIMVGISRSVH